MTKYLYDKSSLYMPVLTYIMRFNISFYFSGGAEFNVTIDDDNNKKLITNAYCIFKGTQNSSQHISSSLLLYELI